MDLDALAVRCPWDQHPNGYRREPDTQLCPDRRKYKISYWNDDFEHHWVRDHRGQLLRCSKCAATVTDEAREAAG